MENLEEDSQESSATAMVASNNALERATTTNSALTSLPSLNQENHDDSVILVYPRIDMVDLTSPTQQPLPLSTSTSAGAGASMSSSVVGSITLEEPSCSKDALKASTCATASTSGTENPISSTSGSAVASSSDICAASAATSDAITTATTTTNVLECPICLQTCIHPARLPCGHIFCFLCVKGVAYKNRRCAMCRREIPPEFLDHPQLVNGIEDICTTKATDDGYQWFYEGRNGWWQYDDRTSQDLEEAFKKGERSCTILVAGYVYIVDFDGMVQQRQNEPARCRRVKRDLATIPKKGVAGLRIEGNTVTTDSNFAQQVYQSRQNRYHSVDSDDLDSPDNSLLRGFSLDSTNHQGPLRLSYGLGGYVIELGNPSEFVSTSAATDAALRIASDIIGSTLAHADELTRSSSSNVLPSSSSSYLQQAIMSPDSSQNPATGELNFNDLSLNSQRPAYADTLSSGATIANSSSLTNTNSVATSTNLLGTAITGNHTVSLPRERGSRELLGAAEDLLGATQRVIASADQPTIDLFEQTLNDFHTLTLRNIVDASDEDDNHQQTRMLPMSSTSSPPTNVQGPQTSQNPHQQHPPN